MALLQARRKLIGNPGRPRRRRPFKSLLQKLHFGRKAERAKAAAALKRSRAAKRAARSHSHRGSPRRKRQTTNPGSLYALGMLAGNPGRPKKKKRSSNMAAHSKRARRRAGSAHHHRAGPRRRRRTPNPAPPVARRSGRRYYARPRRRNFGGRRRRYGNPSRQRVTSVVASAAWTVGGAVATRGITQVVLGDKNTGVMGYLANGITALVLGALAKKMVGAHAGTMITVGGMVGVVLRIVQDYTPLGSVVSKAFSGLGDYAYAGGRGRLGSYEPTDFFAPLASADPRGTVSGAVVIPDAVGRTARALIPAGGHMAGLGGRSRYAGSRFWGSGM